MTRKAVGGIVTAVIGLVIACAAGVVLLVGDGAASGCTAPSPSGAVSVSTPAAAWSPVGRFDAEQVRHPGTIAAVGAQTDEPIHGWIIAADIAIPEPRSDDNLLTVEGRETIPWTRAVRAAQRSAHPDVNATRQSDATTHVQPGVSSGNRAMSVDLEQCLSNCPAILHTSGSNDPSAAPPRQARSFEWVAPVRAPVVSGFRTPERPTHNGVDLGASRGVPIQAASAGTVVMVRCNVVPASHGCDRDGSPSTPGCGWYVDIRHAGEVYTRYCHMLTRPAVVEGQAVAAGQVIGMVGSSGRSSGPHVHVEVHVGSRSEGAVDPVVFMAGRGVRLG